MADIRRVGALLAAAAQAEVMPGLWDLASAGVRAKFSAFDAVTEADEAAVAHGLGAAFPGGGVIGEEAATRPCASAA